MIMRESGHTLREYVNVVAEQYPVTIAILLESTPSSIVGKRTLSTSRTQRSFLDNDLNLSSTCKWLQTAVLPRIVPSTGLCDFPFPPRIAPNSSSTAPSASITAGSRAVLSVGRMYRSSLNTCTTLCARAVEGEVRCGTKWEPRSP